MKKIFSLSIILTLFGSLFSSFIFAYQADRDINFNNGSTLGFNDTINSIAIQNDGKVFVGGNFSSYQGVAANRLIKLYSDGSRDTSFDIGSGFNGGINSIITQNDGKIIVGGAFSMPHGESFCADRNKTEQPQYPTEQSCLGAGYCYDLETSEMIEWNTEQSCVDNNGYRMSEMLEWIQLNDTNITKLNPDGSRDTSFTIGDGFSDIVGPIAVQDDGKIIVGGRFTSYQGVPANLIIRLNPDGSRDSSFDIGDGFNQFDPLKGSSFIRTIAVQNDGKIIVGGNFASYQGQTANSLIRLNTDGSRDTSFADGFTDLTYTTDITTLTIQQDGKIIVGGFFTYHNGQTTNHIIRLNSDGTRDSSFVIGSGFDQSVTSTKIDDNGKIIVGGNFTTYKGVSANRLIRLNTDGSRDTSFDVGNGFNNLVSAIAIHPDGKIIVGGDFTTYKGVTTPNLIALQGNIIIIPPSTDTVELINRFTLRGYTLSGGILSGSIPFYLLESNGIITTALNVKNQNNKLFLPQNIQFKKADNSNYSGAIIPPTTYTGVSNISSKPVLSAISVGSTSQSLLLTNGFATLQIPSPTSSIGDSVSIYSSQNGTNWTFEKLATVSQIDGQPYVSFTTNHFTYFAIAGFTGSFVINNDAASTTSQTVNLHISAPTAQQMKFANSTGELTSASWISYATTYPWTLSAGAGTKTVYAEFDTNGDNIADAATSDTITYGNSNGVQGNIYLQITTGASECVYATSLNLGVQNLKFGSAYDFSGDFGGQWYCSDFKGASNWAFTIQTSDLINTNNNIISGSNLLISHQGITVEGTNACTGFNGTPSSFYSSPLTLIEKQGPNDQICKVSLSTVGLSITVPANQAPGSYSGTLTLDIPAVLY